MGSAFPRPGMVDVEKGEIFYAAPLIPDYAGTKIKARMESEFGLPCEVENDVNCAGLAEATSGAAAGSRSALCLTVGTGIGGCILIDGKVYHGTATAPARLGICIWMAATSRPWALPSILTKRVAAGFGEPEQQWNGLRIFELAKQGNAVCVQAIDGMCDVLGKGIANICYVMNPQVVVLGGGIMAQEEYLRPRIEAALTKYLVSSIREKTAPGFCQTRQ